MKPYQSVKEGGWPCTQSSAVSDAMQARTIIRKDTNRAISCRRGAQTRTDAATPLMLPASNVGQFPSRIDGVSCRFATALLSSISTTLLLLLRPLAVSSVNSQAYPRNPANQVRRRCRSGPPNHSPPHTHRQIPALDTQIRRSKSRSGHAHYPPLLPEFIAAETWAPSRTCRSSTNFSTPHTQSTPPPSI